MTRAAAGPIRLGLVGCGRIAQTHLDALRTVDACKLVGVVDTRDGVAASVAEQHRTTAHTDYRTLLEGGALDAVIICTPPNTHPEIAGYFLDHGIHVLCEKPLAVGLTEAQTLINKAESADRVIMMASKFRYCDDVIKARGIINSGLLGRVILFENVFCSKVDMRQRWNSDRAQGGGGVLIDNGTHSVDIARFMLGPIVKVRAESGVRVQPIDVEDTCHLFFRTDQDAMGAVDLSWSIQKERDAYIEVFGPDGALSIGWKGSKYRQSEKVDWIAFGSGYNKTTAFANQLLNFIGTIRGHEAPLITAEDALESVRVIDAAYRSMQSDQWVDVPGREHGMASVR